jgi:hypothetical protein
VHRDYDTNANSYDRISCPHNNANFNRDIGKTYGCDEQHKRVKILRHVSIAPAQSSAYQQSSYSA